jgi:hypothetical protein
LADGDQRMLLSIEDHAPSYGVGDRGDGTMTSIAPPPRHAAQRACEVVERLASPAPTYLAQVKAL